MAGFFNPFAGGAGGKAPTASEIPYDGSSSGISATDVQGAIDEVQENIENIPRPMSYQGTLGVGGEVTELPAPSETNRGYTYKVITAGTYQGIVAKVGDTFISYATRWDLVPSGDEPSGTVTNVTVTSSDGSVTITGSPITSSGTIDVSVNIDSSYNVDSTKPVTNSLLTRTMTPMTQLEYDALTNKDLPLYFIYEE